MGNWRNRRPHRFFYRQYKDPASSYYDHEEPTLIRDFAEDGVPSWEKNFCSLIGSVPWLKIVNVKKFMYCHGNVVNWDDSAGEEAFQNAKRRYWEEMNGGTSEISLPDPDKYIDKVNWYPDIDAELIKDVDCSFFAPEEGEEDGKLEQKNKTGVSSEGWNRNSGENRTPWECNYNMQSSISLKDKGQCWNQWHTSTDNSTNLKNGDNPWESSFSQGNEAVKGNAWRGCSDEVWGSSHNGNQVNQSKDWDGGCNPWKCSSQGVVRGKDKKQGNPSWNNNPQEPGNSSRSKFTQGSGGPKNRQWRGWKRWDNHNRETKDLELRQRGGGWGTSNDSNRKREGTHQYSTGNKQTRFQGNGYQTGNRWRG